MADKKEKPYRLPAIGKPKKAPPKSSIRELGSKANEQYKAGARDVVRPTFGPKKGQEMSSRDFGKYREAYGGVKGNDPAAYDTTYTGPGKKPKAPPKGYSSSRHIMAEQTGMAKGGLVTKKKKK